MGVSSRNFVGLSLKACLVGILAVAGSIGLAQTMATEDGTYIRIRLVRAQEIKNASVSLCSTSNTVVTETHHVLALTYRYMTTYDTTGSASVAGSGGGSSSENENSENMMEGGDTGSEELPQGTGERYWLSVPSTTGTSPYGWTMGFLVQSGVTPQVKTYDFYDTQNPPQPLSNPPTGLRAQITPGQEITVCYIRRGAVKLVSGEARVKVTHAVDQLDQNQQYYVATTITHQEVLYDLQRNDGFEDTAVDSRKGYGQPNREGQYPADPNAELRNVNFGGWTFKGGMFVGNMPSSSSDKSGTARFQLWRNTVDGSNVPRMMVSTVYQSGKPSTINGGMTVGLFAPLNGADIQIGEDETTWSNKWEITPRLTIPQNGSYEQNKDPYRKFTIGTGDGADLLSVSLTKVYDVPHTNNNITIYKTTWSTPMFNGLCYALDDEGAQVTNGWTGWRYFADKEFGSYVLDVIPTSFTDIAPRVWWIYVDEVVNKSGTYAWQYQGW